MRCFILNLIAFGVVVVGCNSANFQGSGRSKNPSALRPGEASPGKNGRNGSSVNGIPGDGSNPGDGSGGGSNGSGGGDPISGINNACLSKKANDYNIVVVIDTSLSQRTTDPQNLRSASVIKFAQNLEEFAKKSKNRTIQMGVIGFARDARAGQNSPVSLSQESSEKVIEDVAILTRNSGIGTNFEAGLTQAKEMLSAMGAQKNKANQRNFLIFLSDGEPNRGNSGARPANQLVGTINDLVASLADDMDVATISIASGTDIKQTGIDIIKSMAETSQSTSFSDHKGQFIRVDSDDDLEGLSKDLGKAVSGC